MGASAPAWAWRGASAAGGQAFTARSSGPEWQAGIRSGRSGYGQYGFGHNRFRSQGNGYSGSYPWYPWDFGPPDSWSPAEPSRPEVIVLSNPQPPAADPQVLHPSAEPGYIPGCHAILNGFHCDPRG
jgi:hypothetical protein